MNVHIKQYKQSHTYYTEARHHQTAVLECAAAPPVQPEHVYEPLMDCTYLKYDSIGNCLDTDNIVRNCFNLSILAFK